MFISIQDRIRIPNEPSRKINITLSKKELDTNKYLEEIYNLVDSLNGGGVSMTEADKQQEKEEIQLENEKER